MNLLNEFSPRLTINPKCTHHRDCIPKPTKIINSLAIQNPTPKIETQNQSSQPEEGGRFSPARAARATPLPARNPGVPFPCCLPTRTLKLLGNKKLPTRSSFLPFDDGLNPTNDASEAPLVEQLQAAPLLPRGRIPPVNACNVVLAPAYTPAEAAHATIASNQARRCLSLECANELPLVSKQGTWGGNHKVAELGWQKRNAGSQGLN